jgi:polyisoprenyl-phosphate glycosyltransferase
MDSTKVDDLTPRPLPRLLSIVLPAYNEHESVPLVRRRMTDFLPTLPCPVELVIVNDGSRDDTLRLLLEWAEQDRRVKVLGLARNFGHQAALTAGLDAATGDAIVAMDFDLQDPPEVISDMLAKYQEGFDVVFAQRLSREGETFFKRFTAWGFYRMMRTFVHRDLPADAGDFRLVSRRCLDAVRQMREMHRFLRGMFAWVGFSQTAVSYQRHARAAGETKFSMRKMLKFAWTAAVSFSPLPLRLGLILGVIVAGFGLLLGVYAAVGRVFGWYEPAPGWASLVVLVSFVGGAILISNGILGEYVGRIFEEAKGRPLYIVSRSVNFDPAVPELSLYVREEQIPNRTAVRL